MTRLKHIAALAFALALPLTAHAQEWEITRDDCDDRQWEERYCEVREITIAANRDVIAVDGDKNGGIRVEGWDRDEIRIRARVRLWDSDDDPRDVADEIEIVLDGKTIYAEGPANGGGEGWSVSYHLMVPHQSNLNLETVNGGISIEDVTGDIEFEARNGGIELSNLGGDVVGRTTNGGLDIELDGTKWHGTGLDVRTTNGGVKLYVPEDYSAELETGTVNGRIHIDFPIMMEGTIGKRIRTSLGEGGARVRATTTNGGVKLLRS